jgi:hypothetical protein
MPACLNRWWTIRLAAADRIALQVGLAVVQGNAEERDLPSVCCAFRLDVPLQGTLATHAAELAALLAKLPPGPSAFRPIVPDRHCNDGPKPADGVDNDNHSRTVARIKDGGGRAPSRAVYEQDARGRAILPRLASSAFRAG